MGTYELLTFVRTLIERDLSNDEELLVIECISRERSPMYEDERTYAIIKDIITHLVPAGRKRRRLVMSAYDVCFRDKENTRPSQNNLNQSL